MFESVTVARAVYSHNIPMSDSSHEASRNVRPRLDQDETDPWMSLLVGHDEAMGWMHVANNPHLYHDPIAPTESSPPPTHSASSETHDSDVQEDDIADCPSLNIDSHVVKHQKQTTEDIPRIIWNLQTHGAEVLARIEEVAGASDFFYIGISCSIKQRYIGGVTSSDNTIVGHASTGYEAMEILYHTSCRCAKRMERALIARVRNNHDIHYRCRNKSDGGEGMSANAPIYFFYVAYTVLPPQRAPNFSP